ncbi:hypothetical protein OsI_20729 [Oryza sativa Indica Group]|uniref:Uncharacterized protein n=2 Tax=Oryza TaxID=4527 RepID=A0A0E0HH35_ORYNI|nr:hypothetical protein OsI_20729 [Oryza sativa Indica Group]
MGGYGVTRFVAACLAASLVVLLLRCSRCEGRKLMLAAEERGGDEVMHFEGGLELRVAVWRRRRGGGGGVAVLPPPRPRGFSASGGRAERLMRSVPSPGVGH